MELLETEQMQARITANQPVLHDPPRPKLIRTFKVLLEEPGTSLCGVLISSINAIEAGLQVDVRSVRNFSKVFDTVHDQFPEAWDPTKYDALSYTWGSATELYPLHVFTLSAVSGQFKWEPERSGIIHIRKNLQDFLLEMRRRQHTRFMWIDALYTNQDSDVDKTHYIVKMKGRYWSAKHVLISLGEGSKEDVEAIQELPTLTEKLWTCDTQLTGVDNISYALAIACLPPVDSTTWTALRRVLTHPWWSRIWTLQEVTSTHSEVKDKRWQTRARKPATIICGSSSTPWQVFEEFVTAASHAGLEEWLVTGQTDFHVEHKHAFESVQEICTVRNLGAAAVPLKVVLRNTRRREATVPADMILGQCGLFYDGAFKPGRALRELGINVSGSLRNIYVAFATHYIGCELEECLLNHTVTQQRQDDLPSWCPNFASLPEAFCLGSTWRGSFQKGSCGFQCLEHNQSYRAGFAQSGKWQLPRPSMREHAKSYWKNIANEKAVLQTKSWVADCLSLTMRILASREDGGKNTNHFDTFGRTLVANRIRLYPGFDRLRPSFQSDDPVFDSAGTEDFASQHLDFHQCLQNVDGGEPLSTNDWSSGTRAYARLVHRITRRRRFFATSKGYFGIGPSDTQVGDKLCAFIYCPTPYLLRAMKREAFRLVGEVYVHGVMYGEALKWLDDRRKKMRQWIIE